ncbi:amino acid ABC transporter permease [Phyllobacterium sophorae]|uniref:Amino acid ABC transporter permease n=1 Tax=Phyllobacterium sophorae TaxID=1520277 RepID=A0A2P7BFH8_9HYPH|nr:amino acid ABC transporter permease [Phyllobacterium sophorae]PSH65188.1 amino acid ABC transporter permease [Phyllobacterium sophorae]
MNSAVDPLARKMKWRQIWQKWLYGLFGTPLNTLITVFVVALLFWTVPSLLRWLFLDATWTGSAKDCASNTGACWAFIGAKLRFILFALYPPELDWRPTLVIGLLASLLVITGTPKFWTRHLVYLWIGVVILMWMLMAGTLVGPKVPTSRWGGLALTLLISVVGFACAFPIAILLALARRSKMGGLRTLSILFIETVRGVPMIAILYVAMLLVPMMLPAGFSPDALVRAQIGLTLFVAAYLAEVIRAGLQSVPHGQAEAASALGFGYWHIVRLIVLPQALRAVIPALVNLAIGILLNSTLVAVIGIFDLLNAAKNAANDPVWLGFYDESYIFVGLIYFSLCYSASRYSLWLERHLRAVKS